MIKKKKKCSYCKKKKKKCVHLYMRIMLVNVPLRRRKKSKFNIENSFFFFAILEI